NLAAGVLSFSTSHQYLNNLSGNALNPIGVTVPDSAGASTTATTAVEVDNVTPSNIALTLSQSSILEDGSTTLFGTFADPGTLDAHTMTINWGDGSSPPVLNLAPGVLGFGDPLLTSHTYQSLIGSVEFLNAGGTHSGTFNIQVSVQDDGPVPMTAS